MKLFIFIVFKNVFWQYMNKETLILSFVICFSHRMSIKFAISTARY